MIDVIETQAALDASCGEAAQGPWVAVDTEFERIRTYYPRLCLVQLSTPEMTVCVDPLADLDFSSFRALLANPGVVKIFHAARQDLEVLDTALDISVTALFDTQIAAQLCGYREQIAYAELAKHVCEIDLPKQYTRTAWCRRPLSSAEVEYALDDTRYLGAIYLDIKLRLEMLGRDSWVREDCERLTGPEILASGTQPGDKKDPVRCAWFGQDGAEYRVPACALAGGDSAVTRPPTGMDLKFKNAVGNRFSVATKCGDLEKMPNLSASDRRRWSSAILAAVKAGANHAAEYQPLAASVRPSAEQKRTERLLWERLKIVCEKVDIPTAAVAAREDIRKLVRGEQDIRLLQGWRRQFAGRELRDLAANEGGGFTC